MRGFSQIERFPRALEKGYVRAEERSLHEILDLARSISKNIVFYNQDNEPSGNWEQMFLKDEAFLLARIMSVRLEVLQERFSSISNKLNTTSRSSQNLKNLEELFGITEVIPLNLVHWNHYFDDINVRKNVPQMEVELSGALLKLKEDVNRLMDLRAFIDSKLPEGESVPWREELDTYAQKDRLIRVPTEFADETALTVLIPYVVGQLDTIFNAFYATALFLKQNSATYFKASLKSENHEPHSALLIAFIRLMGHAVHSTNTFSLRHQQFYFDKVLKEKKKAPTADKAILTFGLAKTFDQVLIPKGTLLTAGTDANKDEILYKTSGELVVNKATIGQLKTLFVSKDQLYSPEGMRTPMVSGIYEAQIDLGINESLEESWPTLGKIVGQQGAVSNVETQKSEVGFEVSSPNLLLREGKRHVTFEFDFLIYTKALRADLVLSLAVNNQGTENEPNKGFLMSDLLEAVSLELNTPAEDISVLEFLDRITEDAPKGPNTLYLNAWYKTLDYNFESTDYDPPKVAAIITMTAEKEAVADSSVTLGQFLDKIDEEVEVDREASVWEDFEMHTSTFKELKGSLEFYNAVLQNAFKIALTTETGWSEPEAYQLSFTKAPAKGSDEYTFELEFSLDEDFPALTGMTAVLHGETPFDSFPTARFQVIQNTSVFAYSLLNSARLKSVGIKTQSKSIRTIRAYNQYGELGTDGPIQPFGPIPERNSPFQLGAEELIGKSLSKLDINLEWSGLPNGKGGFSEYYAGYDRRLANSTFGVNVFGLTKGQWKPKEGQQETDLFAEQSLSNKGGKTTVGALKSENRLNIDLTSISGFNKGQAGVLKPLVNSTPSGYIRFQLNGMEDPFGHKSYPTLLSKATMEYSRSMIDQLKKRRKSKEEPELHLPNEPYTPVLDRVTIDYETESQILFKHQEGKESSGHFSHLHVFGRNIVCDDPRLPRLIPKYEYEGTLFIGLKDFKAPQTLSIFFHLLESDNSERVQKPALVWYYLSGDQWHAFPKDRVLNDGTNGLLNSGIITLDMPQEINDSNDLLDPGLSWIKVCVANNTNVIGKAITVTLHALEAEWTSENGATGVHLKEPLPPGTIGKLKTVVNGIKDVIQPIETYGGVALESTRKRIIRITERQAHKNRAVVPWDYEKMVLQYFSEIKKAKCFPATSLSNPTGKTPGHVLIGLIPLGDNHKTIDWKKPLVNNRTLVEIRSFLDRHSSEFAKIEVTNPRYETVRVLCKVKFKAGMSSGYYLQTLNADLSNHIAPWQFDPTYKAFFGGNLLESNILGFVQARPYIHYVTELSVVHLGKNYQKEYHLYDTARGVDFTQPGAERVMIEGLYPWSILVPDVKHRIEVLHDEVSKEPKPIGIEKMVVGSDFVINEEE